MNLDNIYSTITEICNTELNFYTNKIINVSNYIIPTAIGHTFICPYNLIYKSRTIINSQKIIGDYHIINNQNIIYSIKDKQLVYLCLLTNTKNTYFFKIKSIVIVYDKFIISYYNDKNNIITIKIPMQQNINLDYLSDYCITENNIIININKLNIDVKDNKINPIKYLLSEFYQYDIFYEICYDIPYILSIKKINYNFNYDPIINKISSCENKFQSKIKLKLSISNCCN